MRNNFNDKNTTSIKRSWAGLGLFTNINLRKGDLIIEYAGEVITAKEANLRGGKYLFELNDNFTIDGRGRNNTARYINHSCQPNCYPELNEDETKVFIFAKKKIAPGEELTYNYGKDYFSRLIKPLGCLCQKCTVAPSK